MWEIYTADPRVPLNCRNFFGLSGPGLQPTWRQADSLGGQRSGPEANSFWDCRLLGCECVGVVKGLCRDYIGVPWGLHGVCKDCIGNVEFMDLVRALHCLDFSLLGFEILCDVGVKSWALRRVQKSEPSFWYCHTASYG